MSAPGGIAIVGMAVRTPGARDLDAFWRNLVEQRDCVRRFTPDELDPSVPAELRARPNFVAARGVLDEAECFDAAFFGIGAREAVVMDPQQRVFLELCWNALEHAGLDPKRAAGTVGVYAGCSNNFYLPALRAADPSLVAAFGDFATMIANEKDYIATRVAHRLDLDGPALSLNTACSTSLVAVCQAWYALATMQCDVALAGGISVVVPQHGGYLHVEGGIEAIDGRCRPFDAAASGTVFGSGGGVVVLKRVDDALADGDTIYAVIGGVGVNNDGGGKASFSAPSVDGQAAVVRMALTQAGFDARSIGYVEAHGTGTPLGDPIEVSALTKAYRADTDDTTYCAIGSAKSNLGHLVAGAGVVGLVKAALALHHRTIPGNANYAEPNPSIDFAASPFRVAARTEPWPDPAAGAPRRAAVSSFGVGGTNAHVVLEEAPAREASAPSPRAFELVVVSARDAEALAARCDGLAAALEREHQVPLADVAYTLAQGRRPMPFRCAVAARDTREAAERLRGARRDGAVAQPDPRIVLLFPGQGSQHAGMARELHATLPEFRDALEECLAIAAPLLDFDLRALLLGDTGDADAAAALSSTSRTQPALFCVEYALARWFVARGFAPAAAIGHSIGEYVAATLAGVFSLPDAVRIVIARATAMASQPDGAMLAVRADAAAIRPLLGEVEIAGYNAPDLTVVAGSEAAIAAFEATLEREVIGASRLAVSHAFHSRRMDGALAEFERAFEGVALAPPALPFHSCVTGAPITVDQATSPAYWVSQIRAPVRFTEALAHELEQAGTVLVECGPGQALTQLARRHRTPEGRTPPVVSMMPPARAPREIARHAVESLGRLWAHGATIDWQHWHAGERRRTVALPGYPFKRERHWFSERCVDSRDAAAQTQNVVTSAPAAPATRLARIEAEVLRVFGGLLGCAPGEIAREASFLDQGLDSLQLTQAALELERAFGLKLKFRRLMDDLDSIASLCAMLARELPAEAFTAAPPAAAATPAGVPAALPGLESIPPIDAAAGPLTGNHVAALLERQLVLIERQLELMRALVQPAPIAQAPAPDAKLPAPVAAANDADEASVGSPPAVSLPTASPLTEAQQEIWLTCQFGDAANCSFNESMTVHLDGELDRAAFVAAVEHVVARHDAFRLRFAPDGESQRLANDAALRVVELDFSGHDAESAYQACCATEAARPFDLEHGPLVRATLVRLADHRHALYFVAHHLVFDGWGASVLVEEMLIAYRALREGRAIELPPAPSFLAYARAEAEPEARAAAQEDLAWWIEKLADAPAPLDLPIDRPRPAEMAFAGATIRQALDAGLWARVREAAARHKASPYAFLLATHFALLARLTGQRDLVVAFPQAGQARGEWQGLVGDCVSFLPLRTKLEPDMTFSALLESVRAALLDAAEHGRCTFGELARAASFAREGSRMPIAQTVLTVNPRYVLPETPGLAVRVSENPKRHVRWDLLLVANETRNTLELDAQYDASVFEASTVRRWMAIYRAMLEAAVADTSRRIDALEADETSLAANPDAPAVPLDDGATVVSLFLDRARAEPDRPAIAARGVRLTYGEVERDSARVAAMLLEAGVSPGDVVAVAMPRRAEILAAALGVWRAGAAYVPIDPTHPGDRLDYMARTAGARVVVTLRDARLPQRLLDGRTRVDVDARNGAEASGGLPPLPQPKDLAYVLFTSGSTGRPKGARILHRGVANLLRQAQHEPGIVADDVLVARATFAFDFAVLELFGPLVAGARVVLADEAEQRDPYSLARLIERERATMLCGTPSQLRAQLGARWPKAAAPLRIVLGGEPVDRALADQLLAVCDEVWNIYGPTETTVYSTLERLVDDGGTITVGRPIANTRVYVVGEDGHVLPQGASGELVIAGAGVSDGYIGAEELTRERYVPDPLVAGARMYRTGDRATQREDGRITLHGRLDHQVKLRGFRIELPEIEAIALSHPEVAEAAATVRELAEGDPRLLLHVVPRPGAAPGLEARVRATLESQLPGYMIPQYLVAIDAMPRSPNGKVDRLLLPPPTEAAAPHAELPRTPLERSLAAIWSELLGRSRIGPNDDFFDLGGHSLLAVKLFARVQERYGVNLPLATLLRHRTLSSLASVLESAGASVDADVVGGASAPTAQRSIEAKGVGAEAPPTVASTDVAHGPDRVSPIDRASADPWTPLVTLRADGSRPPLFFVHAVGGNVLNYRPLAEALGDEQPCYGLQAVGLDGASTPLGSIEAMAERYLPEIRAIQPRGPYRLAGGSMGGVIAFEIAQRLRAEGEEVDLLALFDTYGPDHPWFGGGVAARVAHARALPARDRWNMLREGLRNRARAAIVDLRAPLYWLAGRELPHDLRYAIVSRANVQALRLYRFAPYDAPITLFRAMQQPPGIEHGPTLGWDRIAQGGVDVIPLDGTHESFVEEPALGEELRAVIDRLERDTPSHHPLPAASRAAMPANARNAT